MNEEDKKYRIDTEAMMFLNTMIRIAKDLEKLLVACYVCGGLLGVIAFVLVYRQLTR